MEMPKCRDTNIEEASIERLQQYMAEDSFTAVELARTYLERIKNVNPYTRYNTIGYMRAISTY